MPVCRHDQVNTAFCPHCGSPVMDSAEITLIAHLRAARARAQKWADAAHPIHAAAAQKAIRKWTRWLDLCERAFLKSKPAIEPAPSVVHGDGQGVQQSDEQADPGHQGSVPRGGVA